MSTPMPAGAGSCTSRIRRTTATRGGDPSETSLGDGDELFRCGCCGIVMNCQADHTVPRELAIQVAEHFFTDGRAPAHAALGWRTEPERAPNVAP